MAKVAQGMQISQTVSSRGWARADDPILSVVPLLSSRSLGRSSIRLCRRRAGRASTRGWSGREDDGAWGVAPGGLGERLGGVGEAVAGGDWNPQLRVSELLREHDHPAAQPRLARQAPARRSRSRTWRWSGGSRRSSTASSCHDRPGGPCPLLPGGGDPADVPRQGRRPAARGRARPGRLRHRAVQRRRQAAARALDHRLVHLAGLQAASLHWKVPYNARLADVSPVSSWQVMTCLRNVNRQGRAWPAWAGPPRPLPSPPCSRPPRERGKAPGMNRGRPGLRPFTALVMRAEIGGASRSGSARKQASWAGLTGWQRALFARAESSIRRNGG